MKKDQKTLLYEALVKMQEMSGDSFSKISEITRRRVAKGLIYEEVSLDQFDTIRNFIFNEAKWDINDFNTPEEISKEISRLTAAKSRDLPSMAMENIDHHIQLLKDKSNQKIERPEIPTSFREACVVLESILDPINKTRCIDIFDKNDNMHENVRKFIMDIVEKFKEHVNFPLNIRNIYMIGSSTGYQYSLTSDIDIEIELGITEQQKWDIIPIVPKGTLLPGTQKPLNLFILCKDESYDFDKAENVYDIVRNKWAKKTGKKDLKVPYQYIKDLASFFMNGCDLSISAYERDLREIDEYMALDPEKQEISVKEKFEAIDRKLIDLKNDVDQMKMAHHVIFAFENEGYDGKPFKISIQGIDDPDPRYSINNLVYKMLDKHGYNEKMLKIVKDGRAKVKEIEKYISDNKDTTLQEARRDTAPNHCRRCGCATDPSEYICDDCREKERQENTKKEQEARQPKTQVTRKPGVPAGQLEMVFGEEVLHEYGDVGYFLTKDNIRTVILSDIVMRDANPNIAMLHGTAYNMYDFDINVVKNVKPADIKRYCRPLENVKDDKIAAALSNTIQDIVSEYETKLKKAKLAHMKLIKVDKSSCIDKKIQPIVYSNNSEDPSFEISVGYIKSTISGKRYDYKNIYHIIDIIDSGVKVLSCGDEGPEVSYSKMNIVSFVKDVEERYNAFLKGKPIKESNDLKKDNISEAISVKKEYDGKSLEVELDADLDLKDGKEHVVKSKDLLLKMKKTDGKLDLSVDIETDIKTKNDENIEKYNKKLPIDMKAAKEAGVPDNIPEVLYDALADLSDKRIGALLAFENKQNLDKYCENGEKMDCPISKDIFLTIFYPGTKVHDGATIIKDGVIKYSSVFFKNISGDDFAEHYGARHRAAMGLSKTTDGFCIVVSEESGNISFAVDGKLDIIKAADVKSSKARFIKMFNDNNAHKTVSDIITEALLLRESFGLTTKKEDLPDVKTGDAFKVTFYDDGKYVGEVSVSDDYDGDKLCFAYNIEVDKDLRGQGYGTKIMKHMIDKYHIKSLQVAPDNDVAIHLYKKLGFKKTGEVRMSKTRVDDRMELPSKKRLETYKD